MKKQIIKISSVLFAIFLFFATIETVVFRPEAAATKNDAAIKGNTSVVKGNDAAENETLEVPMTGTAEETAKITSSQTYETLIEIAFLALIGTGFYVLNMKGNSP